MFRHPQYEIMRVLLGGHPSLGYPLHTQTWGFLEKRKPGGREPIIAGIRTTLNLCKVKIVRVSVVGACIEIAALTSDQQSLFAT